MPRLPGGLPVAACTLLVESLLISILYGVCAGAFCAMTITPPLFFVWVVEIYEVCFFVIGETFVEVFTAGYV